MNAKMDCCGHAFPKRSFCGKHRLKIAVCESVCVSNTGAASRAVIQRKLGITSGENVLHALRKEDSRAQRVRHPIKYRSRRKMFQNSKKGKEKQENENIVLCPPICMETTRRLIWRTKCQSKQ